MQYCVYTIALYELPRQQPRLSVSIEDLLLRSWSNQQSWLRHDTRRLLRILKVGGHIFIHRILLDYFAKYDVIARRTREGAGGESQSLWSAR